MTTTGSSTSGRNIQPTSDAIAVTASAASGASGGGVELGISPAELDAFSRGGTEYVFPRIVLTQAASDRPRTRTGPGTVVRNEDGTLVLRMFAQEQVSLSEAFAEHSAAGELLPEDAFFNLVATGVNGSTWVAERLWISDTVHGAVDGSDVRAELPSLTCTRSPNRKFTGHGLDLVIHTDAAIACNRVEAHAAVHSFTRLTLQASDGSHVDIYQRKHHLLLLARNSHRPVSKDAVSHLVEGLAIAAGRQMTVSTEIVRSSEEETTRVNSLPLPRLGKQIWSPFDVRDAQSYIGFVGQYAQLRAAGHAEFFESWRGVLAGWDQGIVVAAAPLGAAIELLVKEWFDDRRKEKSPAVLAAVDAMKKHLDSAPVDDEMRKRGKGAFGQITGKSISAALDALAAEGWFDTTVAKAWGAVRNRVMHGNSIFSTESAAELQDGLDNLLRCLHLFYMLLLIKMQFVGSFSDHSVRGFPRVQLAPRPDGMQAAGAGAPS